MKLFVYGSLMKNRWNHGFMENAEFIGEAVLHDYALYHLITYPAIKPEAGAKVKGELYEIDEAMLPDLDDLEDEGSEYQRTLVKIQLGNEMLEASAYVYLLTVDESRRIASVSYTHLDVYKRQVLSL